MWGTFIILGISSTISIGYESKASRTGTLNMDLGLALGIFTLWLFNIAIEKITIFNM
jgi:hypothetical protein